MEACGVSLAAVALSAALVLPVLPFYIWGLLQGRKIGE